MSAQIRYKGKVVTTFNKGTVTLHTDGDRLDGDVDFVVTAGGGDSPLPIEVTSETQMDALLDTAEVGSVYKYMGTTGIYENGALYIVEAVS
jgi:hypothetical protein